MSSILGDIPVIGSLFGGSDSGSGLFGSSGLLGDVGSMTGITQMIEELIIIYIVLQVVFKLIDKI